MYEKGFPQGIEWQVHEAIRALAVRELTPVHLKTIQHCIAVYRQGFERAYIAYFDSVCEQDAAYQSSHEDLVMAERGDAAQDHHLGG